MKIILSIVLSFSIWASAEQLSPEQKAKVDQKISVVKTWAANAKIVDAVKKCNAGRPDDEKALNQDAWKSLNMLSPVIKKLSKNEVTDYIKSLNDPSISEAFVNCADGGKVAFLSKTSSWNHAGKAKHDKPMKLETWIGEPEKDESTGILQVQVAVPVLDGANSIGVLTIGLSLNKL